MLSRCNNPNTKDWPYYGALGVEVRIASFEVFYAHMGDPPPGKSIDRWPDKNGHYEIGNLRWATPKEQADNKRRYKNSLSSEAMKAICADPRTYRAIAAEYGVSIGTIWRIKQGLSS